MPESIGTDTRSSGAARYLYDQPSGDHWKIYDLALYPRVK